MSRLLLGLFLLVALRGAAAQEMSFPASCAAADSLLGAATARQLRAPLWQSTWPDGTLFARTGTRMASPSGIALTAIWQPASHRTLAAEIQLELTLPADRVREHLLAQDSLLLLLDERPALYLGVPATARVEGPIALRLPLLAPLSVQTLLDLARARSAELRIGSARARFMRISVHVDHPFRSMSISCFGPCRSPISVHVDHLI